MSTNTNMAEELKKGMSSRGIIKKYTAWVIFGAIILVFVFFGFSTRMGRMSVGSAARVNDTFISVADYLSEENRIQQYYSNMFGGKLDMGMQRQFVRSQAIESLVYSELSSQAAQKEGLSVSDQEVRDYILTKMTFLQKEGRFQRDYYDRYLEIIHATPAEFENKVRKEIKNARARQLIEAAMIPMSLEEKKNLELKSNKMNLQYVHIDQEALAQQMNFPEAEVKGALAKAEFGKKVEDYFNTHKEEYRKKETTEGKVDKNLKGDKKEAAVATEKADKAVESKEPELADFREQIAKKLLAQEKVEAGIQALEKALTEKNESVIETQLKALNVKWEETGFFDYTVDAVPKIATAQALEAAFELSTQQPLLTRMIREGNQRYILKLKESKVVAASGEGKTGADLPGAAADGAGPSSEDMAHRRRAESIYANWIEGFKKTSRVEVNNELLKP